MAAEAGGSGSGASGVLLEGEAGKSGRHIALHPVSPSRVTLARTGPSPQAHGPSPRPKGATRHGTPFVGPPGPRPLTPIPFPPCTHSWRS